MRLLRYAFALQYYKSCPSDEDACLDIYTYYEYDTLPKLILGSRVPKSMPNVMNIDVLA